MAQIIINVNDAVHDRIVDGFAARHGWTPTLGISKLAFLRRVTKRFWHESAEGAEVSAAGETARAAARAAFGSEDG